MGRIFSWGTLIIGSWALFAAAAAALAWAWCTLRGMMG